jgi:hypothetical protein
LHINKITLINPALLIFQSKNVKSSCAKHYATQMYKEIKVRFHAFINSESTGSEWSVSCFGHFASGKRSPHAHGITGWFSPTDTLDVTVNRTSLLLMGTEQQLPSHS